MPRADLRAVDYSGGGSKSSRSGTRIDNQVTAFERRRGPAAVPADPVPVHYPIQFDGATRGQLHAEPPAYR